MEENKKPSVLKKILQKNEVGVLLIFLGLSLITGIINPAFFKATSLINLARSSAMSLVPCLGLTFALGSGEIDLSVGSMLALSGVIAGMCMKRFGLSVWLSIVIAMAGSAIGGVMIGAFVVAFAIPPFIVTMGMQNVFRGLVNVLTMGSPYTQLPAGFTYFGVGTLGGLPFVIYVAAIIFVIMYFVMKYTVFGRSTIAIGGNRETARLAGINVTKYVILVHVLCSVCAGIGGMLTTARLGSAQVSVGTGQEMNAIAGCVIGGTSMGGGSPTLVGTVIGVALMELLTVALTLIKIDVYWQKVLLGFIIIGAVATDTMKRSRQARGK